MVCCDTCLCVNRDGPDYYLQPILAGPFTISNCTNTAVVISAALPETEPDPTSKRVVLNHVHFKHNSGTEGGALRVEPGRSVSLEHAVFENNRAVDGAAILLEEGARLTGLRASQFKNNR
jgi:hypothetical protein